MVCKQCGTNCEQNRSFCPVCLAPLPFEETAQPVRQQPAIQGEEPPPQADWGFVAPPQWPNPSFSLNEVDKLPTPAPIKTQANTQANGAAGRSTGYSAGMPAQTPFAGEQAPLPTQGADHPAAAYSTVSRQRSPQYQNAPPYQTTQDTGGIPPYSVKPIASVGGFDAVSSGYSSTGSFGRVPQRSEFDAQNQDDYPTHGQRFSQSHKAPYSRPSNIRRSKSSAGYHNSSRNNLIFFGAAGVLVVLLIVFSVILLNNKFGGVGGFFRNVFGGSPILKPVEVSEGISDKGEEVWEITVFAREGNTITMRIGDEEVSDVINSKNLKLLQIQKYKLLPDKPVEGATAEVAPEVFITTKDGEVVPVDIPLFTVQVPAISLNVTSPQGSSVAVSRSKLSFAGTVDDGGVSVTVQGQPLTVEQDGSFAGEYELGEPGSHTLTVEARKNGYQITRSVFQVEYSQSAANGIDIEVDKSSLRAPGDGDTATVKCKLAEGETMTVSSSNTHVTLGTPTANSATGYTTFTVKMDEVGSYPIEATTTRDGRTNTGVIIVERAPDYQKYTASVHRMDYARMTKEPQHTARYKCTGKVTEVIQSDPYVIAKLSTNAGDILFEYHNVAATVAADDGKTYNIFGDFIGIDEATGLPLVYAWFITK